MRKAIRFTLEIEEGCAMRKILWRVARARRYLRGMRTHSGSEPERRLPALDGWEGKWVAVKDGQIIAAAHNARDLVPELRKLGKAGEGAVAQYVIPQTDTIMIGVG